MKKMMLIILTCLALTATGQSGIKQIENTKSAGHMNIPGTRLYIVPPPGFNIAQSFLGLEKGDYAGFQIYDLIGGNYYNSSATFNREEFEKKGVKVFSYDEFKVNNYPAKLIFMQPELNSKAVSLVFGDKTFCTMVMAMYPADDDKTGEEIQAAIRTIYYDKHLKVDPFATAAFTLDESKSNFKFSKYASGMYIYAIGGKEKQSYNDEPFITVTTMPKDKNMTTQSISDMLLSSLEKYGLTDKVLKHISTENVNGYPAYEVEVYGKIKDKVSGVYQLIITGENKAVAIQGNIKSDFDNTISEMKKLARTVKLK